MKKLLIKLLEPLDRFVFNYMVRAGLIKPFIEQLALAVVGGAFAKSSGGGGGSDKVPEPLTMKELTDAVAVFLFGEEARGMYDGLGDPDFIDRALSLDADATATMGANQLSVLNLYLDGVPAGPNPRKQRAEERLAGLRAKQEAGQTKVTEEDIRAEAQELFPVGPKSRSYKKEKQNKLNREKQEIYIAANQNRIGQDVSQDIAQLQAEIENMPDTVEEVKGLTKIKQEQAQVEGDIQRDQKALTTVANLGLVQDNLGAFTQAIRDADPASRDLSIQATERAGQGQTRIGQRGEELIGRGVRDASVEEQAIRDAGMRRINAPQAQAGVAEQAMLGSGLANIDAVSQPGVAEQGLLGIG